MKKLLVLLVVVVLIASSMAITGISCKKATTGAETTAAAETTGAETTAAAETTGAEENVYKIGANMAFSGAAAAWGIAMGRQAGELVAEIFNKKGGLDIGGIKHKVVIIEGDNKFIPELSATVARRLIEKDKIDLMNGPLAGNDTPPALEVTEKAKLLVLNYAAIDKAVSKGTANYAFRGFISFYELYPAIAKNIHEKFTDIKRIALLDLNFESALYGHRLMEKAAKKYDLEIVYNDYYEEGTQDMYPYLQKVLDQKPDMIINTASPDSYFGLIIKQARELGFKGIFCRPQPGILSELESIAGAEAIEGLYSVDYNYSTSGIAEFVKHTKEKYGIWDANILMSAAPLSAILMAVEEAGTKNSDDILSVLESGKVWKTPIGIDGVFGMEKKYGQPHQWLCPQWVYIVKNGENVPVYEIPIDDMIHGWD